MVNVLHKKENLENWCIGVYMLYLNEIDDWHTKMSCNCSDLVVLTCFTNERECSSAKHNGNVVDDV